jgi:hypothetical protein
VDDDTIARPQAESQQVQCQTVNLTLQLAVADPEFSADQRFALSKTFCAAVNDVAEGFITPVATFAVPTG